MTLWRYGMLLLLIYAWPGAAFNSQDTVNFTVKGNIIQPLCTVNVPSQIDLGSYARQDLSVAGANRANVPFTITLTDCSRGLTQAVVSFSGTPYDDGEWGTVLYANQVAEGAKGLGLQLYNNDGNARVNLANGVSYPFQIDEQTAAGALHIIARMYSPEGKPTAGDFHTAITLNFSYH
ncbi:fimbrial protein SthD [Enterobacter asburiae]|nr:fimbrial protein SthD [Enterobacter asburiae]